MERLATIGVYGFTAETFMAALDAAGIRLLLDVRQRRGVRGSEYAWANSKRLQAALAEADVGYEHHPELAPTTELRRLQYAADDRAGAGKRTRERLAPEFARRYTSEILDRADLSPVAAAITERGPAALLCVERDAVACHRSIVAERIRERYGFGVADLEP